MKLLIKICAVITLLLSGLSARAQMQTGQLDIFAGIDFNYRDMYHNGRIYDLNVNLTPSLKWRFANRWDLSAQALVPLINQWGREYKYVRLNVATVAKQFALSDRVKMKVSGGVFTWNRYGLDVKTMLIANRWLAFAGQVGCTGLLLTAPALKASSMKRITFEVGPRFWLDRWTTEFSARGGRFVYGDWGGIAEAMRHFKHVTVGVYGMYSSVDKVDAGFKVVIMLPPYKRTRRKVNFRPASNFRLTYRNDANHYANREYFTDPEENERTGWFDSDLLPWGPETMALDFKYKEKADSAKEGETEVKK